MRAIAILIILAVAGFFGYQYAVEGRGPNAAIGVLTGATAAAEQAAAEAQAAADAQAAAEAEAAAAQAAAQAEAAAAEAQAAADAAAADLAAAADAATASAAEAGAALMAQADQLLTVEGFDLAQVTSLIEGSDIPVAQKQILIDGVTTASETPALLAPILGQIRAALGL